MFKNLRQARKIPKMRFINSLFERRPPLLQVGNKTTLSAKITTQSENS